MSSFSSSWHFSYSWPTWWDFLCWCVCSYIHNIVTQSMDGLRILPTCKSFKGPGPHKQGPRTQGILSAGGDAPVCCGSVCWSAPFPHSPPGWEDLPWSFGSAGLIPGQSPRRRHRVRLPVCGMALTTCRRRRTPLIWLKEHERVKG